MATIKDLGTNEHPKLTDMLHLWNSDYDIDQNVTLEDIGELIGGTGGYSPSDTTETTIDSADYLPFYDTSATAGKKITLNNLKSSLNLDTWSSTALVDANNQVTFTGLNENYCYTLYCEDKLIKIVDLTITGSGNAVQFVYTVDGAAENDVCKLRIMR